MELPDAIYDRVTVLSEKGNDALDAGRPAEAIARWREALALLPEPALQWDAAGWLHASIGDALWQAGRPRDAAEELRTALGCSGVLDNPFVYFRLGQAQHALGQEQPATENLLKAYMLAGEEIFDDEPEGEALLAFLRGRVTLT